jgi:hypothetical protein
MHFLIDNENKIAFGYSAKAGCSHVKRIYWYLMKNDENHAIHIKDEYNSMPEDYENFTFILILRNPYERIVSGFLDKYSPTGPFRHLFEPDKSLSFENFVNYFINCEVTDINIIHHFTPQTSEHFNYDNLMNSKKIVVYDICNIDYTFIENLYNKKIPQDLIDFRGHHRTNTSENILDETTENIYSLDMDSYIMYKVPLKKFYNEDLIEKIKEFFINDFIFAQNFNILYSL